MIAVQHFECVLLVNEFTQHYLQFKITDASLQVITEEGICFKNSLKLSMKYGQRYHSM